MIGILNPFKNQSFLIEIAKELPDVTFSLLVKDQNRAILQENSKELKNIIFSKKLEKTDTCWWQ